ncbi:MAG TPA: mechanosensitive ion channel domain-containing protein [Paraburkholderia sp.]|jgi:small-conductance mechanosensitive channel|nr:mechanosensitive ion channel domain-containing protein [Paraburkholderia sp.]
MPRTSASDSSRSIFQWPVFPWLFALILSLLACALNATPAAAAPPAANPAPANPAAPVVLTPAQAHAALQMLDNPTQRAKIEDTLRAIAAAGALATPASAPEAASPAAGASAPASASAPLVEALRSNGLVLQLSSHAARSARMIGQHLLHSQLALSDLSSARAWWTSKLHTPEGHALLTDLLRVLLSTLAPALIVEWLIRRLVQKPMRGIASMAARSADDRRKAAERHARDEARDAERRAQAVARAHEASDRADAPPTDQYATAQAEAAAASATQTAASGDDAKAAADAIAPPAAEPDRESAESRARRERHRLLGARHWTLLQRLPAALLAALLTLVPVIAFGLCAGGILSLMNGPDDDAPAAATGDLIDTYVICRVVLVVCSLLFAPDAPSLRLVPLTDASARFAQRWATWLVIVGGIGGALNAAVELGMTEDAHLALVKAVALVAHVMLSIAILACRKPVALTIRQTKFRSRSFEYLAHWFADVWAGVAVFIVMALWFVWALDVQGGYPALMRKGGLSVAVLLAARVVAIVALGALGRVFDPLGSRENMTIGQRRAYRYYPILRRIVTIAIWIVTLDILLHVWGIAIGRFFISAQVGRLLSSALTTIAIAIVVAIVIWEAVNVGAERRLQNWTDAGDYVRAARLRTLLPMLRTSLLVAIIVVVGLTALSQLGVNTGPLVAGASIFGVALGFGSQKLVQDFITGIFLLTENAMQVGDWVTVAGVSGTVEFLSIRTVRLRGGDGSLYTVPFSSVTTVNNTNRGIGNAAVKVIIAHGPDVKRAVDTLKDIGDELRRDDAFSKGILSDFAYWGVDQVDGANVTLVGQIQCTDSTRWSVQREFNRRVLDRFAERGIELANPQRNFVIGVPGSDGAASAASTASASAPAAPASKRASKPAPAPSHDESPSGSTTDARGTSPGSKPSLS